MMVAGDTHLFGFERVSSEEKTRRVARLFDRVASRYDLMNDLMSAGAHRRWKMRAVEALNPQPGEVLLDVAAGTGDVAVLWMARAGAVRARRGGPPAQAILSDVNPSMLRAARRKSERLGRVRILCADARALPMPDRSVDAVSIAFGLRNIAGREEALAEFHRVLKPGGRFVCLEFRPSAAPLPQPLYDAWSFALIPALGQFIVGDADPYRYLVESIRSFPPPERLARTMSAAGFAPVRHRALAPGAAGLHIGWRAQP